jgi:effector-binding domain-containing protein
MAQVKEPQYTLVEKQGNIEIRDYAPIIVAEVDVKGKRMPAINQGFRLIADYIFGNNAPAQKIAMTAPVTQQASGEHWKVRFVMPEEHTLDSLPAPNNPQVQRLAIPARRYAVIRFSGFNTDGNIASHREQLLRYIAEHNLNIQGKPVMAFYNPPWTLPFLKRNEVMIELVDAPADQ